MPKLSLAKANAELRASGRLEITRGSTQNRWWIQLPNAGALTFRTLREAYCHAWTLYASPAAQAAPVTPREE